MRRPMITILGVAAAVLGGLTTQAWAGNLAAQSTGGLDGDSLFNDHNIRVAVGIIFVLVVGSSAIGLYRGRLGQGARDLAIWVGLGTILVAGYGFRDEFRLVGYRMFGDLMPPGEAQNVSRRDGRESDSRDRAVRIRKRSDGHFVAKTEINGMTVTMLVDTGASSVVLKPADARLAGIDVDRLNYSVAVQTANGTAYAAAVRLKRLSVGGIAIDDIEALVAKPGTLGESLLGMSFLRRLRSYEFSGEFLTLRS
jgi:aspartyl protease family protein